MLNKYLVNITTGDGQAEIQLIDGRVRVPRGGWVAISEREAEHDDVVQAIRRNWITLEHKEPISEQAPESVPIVAVEPPQAGSKTPPKKTVKPVEKSA